MALDVEYMMEDPASRLDNLLITQLWTGRRQLFHISLPLLRRSLGTLVEGVGVQHHGVTLI